MTPKPLYFVGTCVESPTVEAHPAMTFEELIRAISDKPFKLSVTRAEFLAMNKEERGAIKRTLPYLVPCTFPSSPWKGRTAGNAGHCNIVALDIDDGGTARAFVENPRLLADRLQGFNFAAYHTVSSTKEEPRIRILVSASAIPSKRYPAAVRTIVRMLGLAKYDRVSETPNQPMFYPAIFKGEHEGLDSLEGGSFFASRPFSEADIADEEGAKDTTHNAATVAETGDDTFNNLPVGGVTKKDALAALRHLNLEMEYADFINVGYSLKRQWGDDGFEVFDECFSASSKYDAENTAKFWKGLKPRNDGTGRTIRCLFRDALAAGWTGELESGKRWLAQGEKLVQPGSHATDGPEPLDSLSAVSIFDLLAKQPDPQDTLLGDRLLCRGGALLFVGPSGIGKSSSSMQQDICWTLGRESFGITPARPLRILTIQAENDGGDLHEMASGVVHGVANNLTEEERKLLDNNLHYLTATAALGDKFLALLDRQLTARPCDLVRVDPLFAFYGAKIEDTEQLSRFLRAGLNPILQRHSCGLILCHHTPKITNRDTSAWSATDYSYSGAGGAELTNWARAILVIDATAIPGTYKWIAAKRGGRIGWRDALDKKEFIRFYKHSSREGVICWEGANPNDVAAADNLKRAKLRACAVDPVPLIEKIVPLTAPIEKNELLAKVNSQGAGKASSRDALARLLAEDEPRFFEHLEKRPKTNERRLIARFPKAA